MIELDNKIPIKVFSEVREKELSDYDRFKLKQFKELEKIESKHCKTCGNILRNQNSSGYCRMCYRSSQEYKEKQKINARKRKIKKLNSREVKNG